MFEIKVPAPALRGFSRKAAGYEISLMSTETVRTTLFGERLILAHTEDKPEAMLKATYWALANAWRVVWKQRFSLDESFLLIKPQIKEMIAC
ncbi:MAG TPA: hypothetical protein VGK02_06270 [Candidatus Aquicultor sp.]|jgi:hypothetical protein